MIWREGVVDGEKTCAACPSHAYVAVQGAGCPCCTKPAPRATPATPVPLNVQGVLLRDVRRTFYGLWVNAGRQVAGSHDGGRPRGPVRGS